MSIADSLINYPQAPKLKTNYAANALQNLQQSGNPFAGIASAPKQTGTTPRLSSNMPSRTTWPRR